MMNIEPNTNSSRQPSAEGTLPNALTHNDLSFRALASLALITLVALMALNYSRGMIADEAFHFRQVFKISKGESVDVSGMPYPPGYHFLQAAASYFYPGSLNFCRAINALLSLICIALFYLACRHNNRSVAGWRSAQLLLLPITIPYWPLVYTDTLSLALVILALYLSQREHIIAASLILLASLFVRQSNIIWAAFIFTALYTERHQLAISPHNILNHLRQKWPLVCLGALFILFVLWNKGISIGDKTAHPVRFQLGNIYFFLALYALLLAPHHIASITSNRSWPIIFRPIVLFSTAAAAIAGMWLINNDHPYYENDYYVRHRFITYICQSPWHKLILAVPASIGLAFLMAQTFCRPFFTTLTLFIFLSLIPISLIEQRYSIPAFCLLLIAQQSQSMLTEKAATLWLAFLSAGVVLYLHYNQNVFL